nr:MAG TPA: hypothetical protein [Bacteriophage sp.]
MTKILKVVKPFFVMEIGDTFEYDNDTNQYKSVYNVENNSSNDNNSTVMSSYSSVYTISTEYAKVLIGQGYLEQVDENTAESKKFVNVFDEISNLISVYNKDLADVLRSDDNTPQCLKIERETVLRNMIKLLEHLNSLKK